MPIENAEITEKSATWDPVQKMVRLAIADCHYGIKAEEITEESGLRKDLALDSIDFGFLTIWIEEGIQKLAGVRVLLAGPGDRRILPGFLPSLNVGELEKWVRRRLLEAPTEFPEIRGKYEQPLVEDAGVAGVHQAPSPQESGGPVG
jgi:hypothetical protein